MNGIAFPFYQKLTFTTNNTNINNILHLILKLLINKLRLRALARHLRRQPRCELLKLTYMKNIMKSTIFGWESHTESYIIDLGLNQKGANKFRR